MASLCDFCGKQRSMIYCRSDAALLCLLCDRNVHSPNSLSRRHIRTLLCDRCCSQPASVRCLEENASLCQNCDWNGHDAAPGASGHKKQAINCYSGCPSSAELSRIWSFVMDTPTVAAEPNSEDGLSMRTIDGSDVTNHCDASDGKRLLEIANTTPWHSPGPEGSVAGGSKDSALTRYMEKKKRRKMDDMYIELDALECAVDGSKKPCSLKFSFLQFITKQFSDELKIGHGGCGLVYKGILPNRVIAVKKFLNNQTIDDKMFHQEVTSLMMVAHKNVVRLLGYCSHTEEKAIEKEGLIIMAETRERLLCFEYVTNGSLENHITDELRGLEWYTRYQIIKGICEGLHHLHKEKHIIHLDLKPANILLDDDMVPKISDFGLSRHDEKTHTLSAERLLTLGYCAPEYMQRGKRSAKSDIYSFGVIITELVTGSRGNPCITKVLRRWKHRWNKSAIDTQLWFKQVSTCLDLALRCKHTDPTDRPNISDIITDLNKMDNADAHINNDTEECLKLENMLDIGPLEMHFPFELNKLILGSIELTNDTDDYFAFRMSSISVRPYVIHPFKGIVSPRSKCNVTIMLQTQEMVPPQFPCKDEFSVQSTRVDMNLTALDITEDMFHEELGKVVDEVTLTAVLYSPPQPDNISADL